MGTLYLVTTPIGNLEDLSPRAARILGEVETVLAEDTRRTGILLRHLGLSTPLLSLHAHNEEGRGDEVLHRLRSGAALALVSDAGTPLVSDPGERLVRRALDEGQEVVPIPGPSAILHALVGSGLPPVPFTFLGFLPRKGKERDEALDRVALSRETVVFFESPERTARTLADLEGRCGAGRRAAVARELTKLHEEFRRGTLEELAGSYATSEDPKGEVTLVVAPAEGDGVSQRVDEEAGRVLAEALLRSGSSPSRAAHDLSRRLGISRNRAYALVQELVGEGVSTGAPVAPHSGLEAESDSD
ncbi:MAG: 16S rRNA (cytidine(1402)-2'-O)-methyltransferase [Gemmatimonadota bacterium]